jgi:hypothetical protein
VTSGTARFDHTLDDIAKVADAVLFEGYLLYPYRASAQKNQLRWQFGVLTPRPWAQRAAENWYSRTECLLEPDDHAEDATLRVRLRFLRLQQRQVQRLEANGAFVGTDRLIVHDAAGAETLHMPWDEGLPEVIDADLPLAGLVSECVVPVELPAEVTEEAITDARGTVVGRLLRETWAVRGRVVVATEEVPGPYGALRLRVRVENVGLDRDGPRADVDARDAEQGTARDGALRHSLIAAHTVLALSDGEFLSMTDPPEWARPAVEACVNEHVWPVLGGTPERPNVVLSSPIILADFPEIAPESPNQLFDGLENDEILTLRTMVLTDEEKREARATDPRAAHLVDAVDSMPPEIFERLHGVIRSMGPAGQGPTSFAEAAAGVPGGPGGPSGAGPGTVFDGVPTFGQVFDALGDAVPTYTTTPDEVPTYSHETGGNPWWDPAADASVDPDTDWVMVGEHRVAKGTRVLLRPNGRADAQDLFLVGRPAMVEAVLNDVDGDVHLAVSLTDDPASEFQAAHGRFRYFRPDEVEVVR